MTSTRKEGTTVFFWEVSAGCRVNGTANRNDFAILFRLNFRTAGCRSNVPKRGLRTNWGDYEKLAHGVHIVPDTDGGNLRSATLNQRIVRPTATPNESGTAWNWYARSRS